MLTVPEAAEAMRCSTTTVYRMIGRGELPAIKVAGRFLMAPEDLPTARRPRTRGPGKRAPGPASLAAAEVAQRAVTRGRA